MEELLRVTANHVALAVETVAVLIVAFGAVHAVLAILAGLVRGPRHPGWGRPIWVTFGGWLLGGLQFALAADIVRSAISPTWEQIGQLGGDRRHSNVLELFPRERSRGNRAATERTRRRRLTL